MDVEKAPVPVRPQEDAVRHSGIDELKRKLFPRQLEAATPQRGLGLSRAQIEEELKNPELATMLQYCLTGDSTGAALHGNPEPDPVKAQQLVESNMNKLKALRFLEKVGIAKIDPQVKITPAGK